MVRVLQERYGLRRRAGNEDASLPAAEPDAPQPEQVAFRW